MAYLQEFPISSDTFLPKSLMYRPLSLFLLPGTGHPWDSVLPKTPGPLPSPFLPLCSRHSLSKIHDKNHKFEDLDISEMFDFKYKEDVEKCFSLLKINRLISEDSSVIDVKNRDALIDLSPCIGIYQEAVYFDNYQIDAAIRLKISLNPELHGLYTDSHRTYYPLYSTKSPFASALPPYSWRTAENVHVSIPIILGFA